MVDDGPDRRRNALGWMAGGGSLVGAGLAADAAVDADRRRRGLHGPFRSLRRGGLSRRVVAGSGVKAVSVGVKGAGVPLVAYGGYKLARGERAPKAHLSDVIGQGVRGATFVDAAGRVGKDAGGLSHIESWRVVEFLGGIIPGSPPPAPGPGEVDPGRLWEGHPLLDHEDARWARGLAASAARRSAGVVVGKSSPGPMSMLDVDPVDVPVAKRRLTDDENARLSRHKDAGRALSIAGGSLGLSALALRAPEVARLASRVRRVGGLGPVRALASRDASATRLSNTLGVAAIGTGSAGSFNYAAQQKLERKALDRPSGMSKGLRDSVDRRAYWWSGGRRAGDARRARFEEAQAQGLKDMSYAAVAGGLAPGAALAARRVGLASRGTEFERVFRLLPGGGVSAPAVPSRTLAWVNPAGAAVRVLERRGAFPGKLGAVARVASHPASVGLVATGAAVPLALHARREHRRFRQASQEARDAFVEERRAARVGKASGRVKVTDLPWDRAAQSVAERRRRRGEEDPGGRGRRRLAKRDRSRAGSAVEAAAGFGLMGAAAGGNRIAFGGQRRYADFVDYASRRESEYLEGRFPHGIAPDGRPHVPFVAPSGPLVGGRPPALPREEKLANKEALKRKHGRLAAINERRNRLHASSARLVRPVAGALIGTGLVAGPVLAWHGSRGVVDKGLSRGDVDAAFAGAAVPVVAYHGTLYGTKPLVDSRLDAAIRADPDARKAVAARRQELGLAERGKPVIDGDPRMKPFFRSYPKSVDMPVSLSVAGRSVRTPVKAWQWKRGMSYLQGGKTQLGITGGLALAGAAGGVAVRRSRRRGPSVEKAMFPRSYGVRLRKPAIRSSYVGTSRLGRKFTVRGSVGA